MNTRYISDTEIAQRQQQIRTSARAARYTWTVAGLRQLLGSTFIALGTHIHGCMEKRPALTAHPSSALLEPGISRNM
jgi:hypothetical protein